MFRIQIRSFRSRGAEIFRSRKAVAVSVVKRFIAALNARDIDSIAELLDDDCRVVDSSGGWIDGRQNLLEAVGIFFEFDPAFRLEADQVLMHGEEVLIRGSTVASHPHLASITLWRARVWKGKVAYFQGFGDKALPLARILLPEKACLAPANEDACSAGNALSA